MLDAVTLPPLMATLPSMVAAMLDAVMLPPLMARLLPDWMPMSPLALTVPPSMTMAPAVTLASHVLPRPMPAAAEPPVAVSEPLPRMVSVVPLPPI